MLSVKTGMLTAAGDMVADVMVLRLGGNKRRSKQLNRVDGDGVSKTEKETVGVLTGFKIRLCSYVMFLRIELPRCRDGQAVKKRGCRGVGLDRRVGIDRQVVGLD